MHRVAIFDGEKLPGSHWDIVLFVTSLHHAGSRAPTLLREAARVSSRWIIVIEAVDAWKEQQS